jgi:hypothetical protein
MQVLRFFFDGDKQERAFKLSSKQLTIGCLLPWTKDNRRGLEMNIFNCPLRPNGRKIALKIGIFSN